MKTHKPISHIPLRHSRVAHLPFGREQVTKKAPAQRCQNISFHCAAMLLDYDLRCHHPQSGSYPPLHIVLRSFLPLFAAKRQCSLMKVSYPTQTMSIYPRTSQVLPMLGDPTNRVCKPCNPGCAGDNATRLGFLL